MSIEQELKKFEKTERFQQLVREAKEKAAREGKPFGCPSGLVISKEMAAKMAKDFVKKLLINMNNAGLRFYEDDLIISTPIPVVGGGYKVDISFDPGSLHRDSLYSAKYPNGVDNIVSLFTHGWDTDGRRVFGTWHNSHYQSRMTFKGDDFMQRAIDDFNFEMGKIAEADCGDEY